MNEVNDSKTGFVICIKSGFQNAFNFGGRATRPEFWYWTLFTIISSLGLLVVEEVLVINFLIPVFDIIIFFPGLSIFFRRLQDTGVSGWWFLVSFTIIGTIPLYLWLMKSSKSENNPYETQTKINTAHKFFASAFFILILVWFIYGIETYSIPSGGLLPTIHIGDHIFTKRVWSTESIVRGDIVVFPYPIDPEITFIKRAIGLPGETLEISKDHVFINGEVLEEPYAYFEPKERLSRQAKGLSNVPPVSRYGPIVIPEDKLFVMGDNRYNSADSRYWGFVDLNSVQGKAWLIYWSNDLNRLFKIIQ